MTSPWRNRIVGTGAERPDQLLANPWNFRRHPAYQRTALRGAMHELGVIQNVIVNRTTGRLIDGHLRVELALAENQPEVPVVYVDLTEEEELKAIASLDPIGALAQTDDTALRDLLVGLEAEDEELAKFLADLGASLDAAGVPDIEPPNAFPEVNEGLETEYRCPKCDYEWSGKPK